MFFLLTGLGWGLAYADGFGHAIQVAFVFVLGHFLGSSLLVSTLMYFLVGRVLGKRRQGLFGPPSGGEETLEFGYCFDVRLVHPLSSGQAHKLVLTPPQVAIRAFLPVWAFLYVLQFLLMPLIAQDYWVSNFFGNTLYLVPLAYYLVITFLGYNGTSRTFARYCDRT